MSSSSTTASHLEAICAAWTMAWNARDWNFTRTAPDNLSHIDTNRFRCYLEDGQTLNWAETIEHQKATVLPGHSLDVTSIRANVHEHLGWASVIIQANGEGNRSGGEGLNFVFAFETSWRKKEHGIWMCYEMTAIRGTANHTGFV